jgi:2-polyprenyl-6-methoxyphenol hydroxylase-like FAD-dependent oxidoreductase
VTNIVRYVVVGAGVAGVSLAIMLAEQGIESQVLESRERCDGPTSGVRISSQGVGVLRLMKLDAIGKDTERVEMRFGGLSASFSARKGDASAIMVTRLALHEQLMRRARSLGARIVTGFEVATMTESADGVEVTSESNEKVTGTLLVGADGVGSTLRQILNPEQRSTKADGLSGCALTVLGASCHGSF